MNQGRMTISNSRSRDSLQGKDIVPVNSMGMFLRSFLRILGSVELARAINALPMASQSEPFLDSQTVSCEAMVSGERRFT